MSKHVSFRTPFQRRPVHCSSKQLLLEALEQRLCLSTTTTGALAPRLGVSPFFHTPGPEAGLTTPRLGTVPPVIVSSELLDLDDGLVAFLTNEAAQGKDLNRDGDKLDNVLQSFDANTGIVHNSRQAALGGSLVDLGDCDDDRDDCPESDQGLVAFLTPEHDQRKSLNKDGDKLDLVLQVFDARTGVVRNSQQAVLPGSLVDLDDGSVVFLTQEAAQGRVLNGDGDKLDNVLQSFDFSSNTVRNSGQQANIGSPLDIGDGFVAFSTRESAQGSVLNSDGDKLDSVLQVFEPATGLVQNTGQAV